MKTIALIACVLANIALPLAIRADAASTRTFVSSSGSDSNDCSRFAPCRSFATAITKTSAGGEINTLDPGGYGPLTITKSISIVSGLGEAGILVPAGGIGITISAGSDDQINLRGLAIEGAGVGKMGIVFNSGGALTVTNSVIRNLTDSAFDLEPTGTTYFTITDTLVSDNGRVGIYFYPQGASATVYGKLSRVTVSHNQWGVYANGNAIPAPPASGSVRVSISDSTIANNTKGVGLGIYANGLHFYNQLGEFSTNVRMLIDTVSVHYNKQHMAVLGSAVELGSSRFGDSLGQAFSCSVGGYSFHSFGDNRVLDFTGSTCHTIAVSGN